MNPDNRLNIVNIGALAGALSWFICWALEKWAGTPLGAEGGVAMSTIITYALQYADRVSKRADGHVLTKYGPGPSDPA